MGEAGLDQFAPAIKPFTTSEERTWAALAHLSTVVTMLISFATAGVGGLLFVFVPFVIYLMYKDRSEYVAYHAAQAFAIQIIGTLGYFLLIIVGSLALALIWVIIGLLSAILIGIILIPVGVLVTLLFVLVLLLGPIVLIGFSIAATIGVANGGHFRYPYLGRWVGDWLARSEAEAVPAV